MAAVLTPKSLSFPHNILQDNFDHSVFPKMHRESPPRPSLPSISDLIADLDKTAENASATSPSLDPQRRISAGSNGTQPSTPDRMAFVTSPTSGLPPTPPLPGTSSFDFAPRPGSLIIGSPITHSGPQNGHFPRSPSTTTSADAYLHQRSSYPPVPDTAAWNNSKSPVASRRASDESRVEQHGTKPEPSYPNLPETNSAYSGLSQQRPLPANFPPSVPVPGQQHSPSDARMGGTQYEHHHHYPVSGTSPYPQATDRYQCPTCQKAFSRPSSLKIHTYSHTGEKPFKCKYEGCGKYFSVRSNMKRHEKGCHGAESSSNGGNSPKGS